RIVEGKRGERVDGAVVSGVPAIVGLDADDRDDDLGGDAELGLRSRKRRGMRLPEGNTRLDSTSAQELREVFVPLRRRHYRPRHGVDDLALKPRLGEQAEQCLFV